MQLIILLFCIPPLWRLFIAFAPAAWIEPYSYWSSASLNTPNAADGRVPSWRNMGYWDGTTDFTTANEALAHELLTFADAKLDGNTLDMAHGDGESLLLHLEHGPKRLDALTSLPAETRAAKELVTQWEQAHPDIHTDVTFFTMSATYRPTFDFEHPLNFMRGFTGASAGGKQGQETEDEAVEELLTSDGEQVVLAAESSESSESSESTDTPPPAPPAPEPYDLVYVLDAAYHFQPAIGYFAASVLPVLRAGTGVLAYTDILPPPQWATPPLSLAAGIVGPLLSVPPRNLNQRHGTLEAYADELKALGFEDVRVEDWSEHVFPGLAANLRARGGLWAYAAKLIDYAHSNGWRYLAVRAVREETESPEQSRWRDRA